MDDDICYGCFKRQSDTTNAYRFCGECGHVYQTLEELENVERRLFEDMGIPWTSGLPIYTCPCCTHDF